MPLDTPTDYDVFISYKSEDQASAIALQELLKSKPGTCLLYGVDGCRSAFRVSFRGGGEKFVRTAGCAASVSQATLDLDVTNGIADTGMHRFRSIAHPNAPCAAKPNRSVTFYRLLSCPAYPAPTRVRGPRCPNLKSETAIFGT